MRKHFIEFVLIFSAIVLGFFAENLREYYTDKASEKEFIISLAENLKADSVVYVKRDAALQERIVWMDTLMGISKNLSFITSTLHPSPEEKGTRSF